MILIMHNDLPGMINLRRFALRAQGLLQMQAFGRGRSGALKAIQHLGYIQLDTISVVERAHHHVLYTRVPGFKPSMTNQLLKSGDVFEYWSHAAAFLPVDDFRFSLPYKHAIKSGQTHWFKDSDKMLMKELLARIRSDGPLCARDVESKRQKSAAGWWDWKPAKKALEQLYMQGDLMVCDRHGFQKTYDLTERVLPTGTDTSVPSVEAFAQHLLSQQLRCHAVVTLKGLTYLRRNSELRKAMKQLVNQRLAEGSLVQVQLGKGEGFLVDPDLLEQPMPRANNRLIILSPFDNGVIQRDRLQALFDFDYQIECYVPAAKRKFGYFSLPLLYRDQFIGRMDCKAHRKDLQLEIKSLHLESRYLNDSWASAWLVAIEKFRDFQGCKTVSVNRSLPQCLLKMTSEIEWLSMV